MVRRHELDISSKKFNVFIPFLHKRLLGRHGKQESQGSQGLVLGWILRKWWPQRACEVAATMASLPAKNLPWRPWFERTL